MERPFLHVPFLSFFETPWWIPMSFCDITKAKSRFSGLQTTQRKSGKPNDFHVAYKGTESLFFRLKILFNWKIIVVEVTQTILSPGN